MDTAVVTGAGGFVGGHLVQTLTAAGRRVFAVDRAECPAHLAGRPGVEYVTAELTSRDERVDTALCEAYEVFHLAGCPGVRDASTDVEWRRHRDNVLATAAVIAATPAATPLVVTSSSSVYGGARWHRPSREDDELHPRGGYAASKVAAERLCERRRAEGGRVLVARPFTVAGERQRPDMALARWIAAARAGLPLPLFGSPERTRDITDVRDVARCLAALAETGASGVVNVGTGRSHTLAELADAVCAAVGRDVPRLVVRAADEEVRDTLADTTRLHRLIGFGAVTRLADLVARQVAATRQSATEAPDVQLAGAAT
jgi:nucleoside-diphosphate-sugar epimerase